MTMVLDDGLELLAEEECLALLRETSVGRVGITVGGLPVILPVNYACHDGDIVFRTGSGTKLRAAVRNAVIAFEADVIHPSDRAGWSVLVVGRARELSDDSEIAAVESLGIEPWVAGSLGHVVRLHPEFVSGRRIGALGSGDGPR